jgi:hypothetical protein
VALCGWLAETSIGCRGKNASERRSPVESKHAPLPSKPTTETLDWSRHRAYQALPGAIKLSELCTARVVKNLTTQRFLRMDVAPPLDLYIPEVEPAPRGYRNHWHDECPANVIVEPPKVEPQAPLVRYQRPDAKLIADWFAPGRSLYWIGEGGQSCVEVRVKNLMRPRERRPRTDAHQDSSLEAIASLDAPPDAIWKRFEPFAEKEPWIPVVVVSPRPGHLGYVFMGTWQRSNGMPFFKCQCERLFRVMAASDRELRVLPQRFPGDKPAGAMSVRNLPTHPDEVRYYDLTEVERWFADRPSCEAARNEALTRIRRDGRETTRTGFYSGYSEFDESESD